jgi:hypothetical protein
MGHLVGKALFQKLGKKTTVLRCAPPGFLIDWLDRRGQSLSFATIQINRKGAISIWWRMRHADVYFFV